jgi:hypothetical protein
MREPLTRVPDPVLLLLGWEGTVLVSKLFSPSVATLQSGAGDMHVAAYKRSDMQNSLFLQIKCLRASYN